MDEPSEPPDRERRFGQVAGEVLRISAELNRRLGEGACSDKSVSGGADDEQAEVPVLSADFAVRLPTVAKELVFFAR
ncbi:hypothetical protein AB0L62_29010 [Nocardia asteroides]|uniref:hypothetical protein n=1 Tax=Nocardia asteroides TaxID=1824 RepID=UPI0034258978